VQILKIIKRKRRQIYNKTFFFLNKVIFFLALSVLLSNSVNVLAFQSTPNKEIFVVTSRDLHFIKSFIDRNMDSPSAVYY
jgi:hypothetical protein